MKTPFLRRTVVALAFTTAVLALHAAPPAPAPAERFNELLTGNAAQAPAGDAALAFLEKLATSADAECARAGANPADVGAQAAVLGAKTEDLFAFVRDRVATEPYAGQLRGAAGALAARAGNPVDKSQLLAALLRAQNRECRLVKAALPDEAVAKLLDQVLAADPRAGVLGDYARGDAEDPALARLAAGCGLEAANLRALLAQLSGDAAQDAAAARTLADGQTAYVAAQLAAAKVATGRTIAAWREQLGAALRDHVWVQTKVSDDPERWLDLDPAFASAKPGETFVSDAAPVDGDPAERHSVQFTLVYRRTVGGTPEDKTLLDLTLPADEFVLAQAKFAIQPAEPMPGIAEAAQLPDEVRKQLLRDVKKFRAVFQAGASVTASEVFDLDGAVDAAREASAKGMGASMGGGFGLGGGDDAPAGETKFVELAAVFTFHGPGNTAPAQRRVLYSAAQRQLDCTATPMLECRLLLQPQWLSPALAGYASLRQQAATLTPAVKILRGKKLGARECEELVAPDAEPYSRLLMALAQIRQAALAEQLCAQQDVAVFCTTPQLVLAEERVCTCPGENACGRVRIDIVSNGAAFVPRTAAAETAAWRAALRQGVFDTVAEGRLLVGASATGAIETPIATFEAARAQQATLRVFAPTADDLPVSAEDRAWIASCEAADRLVVFAPAAVPGAHGFWWSLDPQTGVILGRASGGYGDAATEYSIKIEKVAIKGLKCFASASFAWGKSGVKHGQFTDADGWSYAVGTFSCVMDMTISYTKMEYAAAYPKAAQFVDWAAPQVVDFLKKNGPGS